MNTNDLITVDSCILAGTPVFRGTQIPIKTLFDHLESNRTLDEFLLMNPGVSKETACAVLELSESALLTPALEVDDCSPWPIPAVMAGCDMTPEQQRSWAA